MPWVNGILILDYPDLINVNLLPKQSYEEMRKHTEQLREIARKNNVVILLGETEVTL